MALNNPKYLPSKGNCYNFTLSKITKYSKVSPPLKNLKVECLTKLWKIHQNIVKKPFTNYYKCVYSLIRFWKWLLCTFNGFTPSKTDPITKIMPLFSVNVLRTRNESHIIFWMQSFFGAKCYLNCLEIVPTFGPKGAWDWNQMKQDQVSGVHFDHI